MKLKYEYSHSEKLKTLKDRLLKPLTISLHKFGLRADYVSIAGLLLIVPIYLFFDLSRVLIILLLLLKIFFDLLDGSLARIEQKKPHIKGQFIDLFADHLFIWLFAILLFYFEGIGGVILPIFLLVYCVNFFLNLLNNISGDDSRYPYAKIYTLILLFFLDSISGFQLYNVYYVAEIAFMSVVSVNILRTLQWNKLEKL